MISVEQARDQIRATLTRLPVEHVPLSEALDRFAAEDVAATRKVPGFDNSAFDGYAVRSADLTTAAATQPVTLRLVAAVAAGSAATTPVGPGQCVRIFTGAPLPPGADAIVMQEESRSTGPDLVEFAESIKPWEGVRFAGEDVRPGDVLAHRGQTLTPGVLGLIASVGIAGVPVHRRPRIQLLSTGSELVEPGCEPGPGQIHDSNRILLEALIRRDGASLVGHERVPDRTDATLDAIRRATAGADVLVTTGGVSVGEADLMRPAFAALGGSVDLWRIAMKPGKPFAFGRLGSAVWFGLPGNPVAALVTWRILVRPALRQLAGATDLEPRRFRGVLGQDLANRGGRRHFVRVILDEDGVIRSAGTQASHVQSSAAAANALLDLPAATVWEKGRAVEVVLLD